MKHHLMWDTETFGIQRNSIIWSIGVVKFTRDGIVDRFQVGIDPQDCERYGGKIDASTFDYWMRDKMQPAREKYNALAKVDLHSALMGLTEFIELPADNNGDIIENYERGSAYGKGSTFDNVLLKDLYDMAGLSYPIHYREDECYRTLANRFPDVGYVQLGVAHDSLDDAMSQADHLIRIAKAVPGFDL